MLLQTNLLFSDGPPVDHISLDKDKEPQPSTSGGQSSRLALEIDTPIRDDGFGGNLDQDITGAVLKFSLVWILVFCMFLIGWVKNILPFMITGMGLGRERQTEGSLFCLVSNLAFIRRPPSQTARVLYLCGYRPYFHYFM